MEIKNKILQIGAGSMGTRRIRDLSSRTDVTVALFDQREDRREKAGQRFGIETFKGMSEALAWGADSLSISTPPDRHEPYIETALDKGLNFFSEADIWTYNYQKIESITASKGIVAAPSCTLYFFPIIREMKRIVEEELGALATYSMCLSVDAPNWHPTEGQEYYARHRSTAPGREMVPFELIALNYIFGPPADVAGSVRKTGKLQMDSEDTWCLQMSLESRGVGQLSVLMASPQSVRRGWAVGVNGFVDFDLLSGNITRTLPAIGIEDTRNFGKMSEILESAYAEEMSAFVSAIQHEAEWPFSYREGSIATSALAAAEKSSLFQRTEKIDLSVIPALLPDQYK